MIKKLLFVLLFTSTLFAGLADMTSVTAFRYEEVKALRPILDQWAIDAYREYPYLYVYQEETDYNTIFEVDPDAIVLFAELDGQKLGMISASPLSSPYLQEQAYTPSAYLDQIKAQGFNPETIYYISCFLMQKDERQNKEAALLLFDKAVAFARSLGKTQIAYMEISPTPNHPLKHDSYLPCEPWALLNCPFRTMNTTVVTSWPTLQADGSVCEQTHRLPLYVMDIELPNEALTQKQVGEFFDYLEHIGDACTEMTLVELEKHVQKDVIIQSNGQPICSNSVGFLEYVLENRKRFTKVSYRPSFHDAIYTNNSASIAFDVYCTTVDDKAIQYRAMAQIFLEDLKIKRWVEVVESVTNRGELCLGCLEI